MVNSELLKFEASQTGHGNKATHIILLPNGCSEESMIRCQMLDTTIYILPTCFINEEGICILVMAKVGNPIYDISQVYVHTHDTQQFVIMVTRPSNWQHDT